MDNVFSKTGEQKAANLYIIRSYKRINPLGLPNAPAVDGESDMIAMEKVLIASTAQMFKELKHNIMSIYVEMTVRVSRPPSSKNTKWEYDLIRVNQTRGVSVTKPVSPGTVDSAANLGMLAQFDKNIRPISKRIITNLREEIEELKTKGSNWNIDAIDSFKIYTHRVKYLKGSAFHQLPDWIARKKACINVQNNDERCFAWSVCACLMGVTAHPERVSHYKNVIKSLNMSGIQEPVRCEVEVFRKWEKQNPAYALYVSVADDDSKKVWQFYRSSFPKRKPIDLLYHNNHYAAVANISRLYGSEISKQRTKKHICRNCSLNFTCEENLAKHITHCWQNEPTAIALPTGGADGRAFIKFAHYSRQRRHQFVVYADFESSITAGVDEHTQVHSANSYGLYLCSVDSKINRYIRKSNVSSTELIKQFYADLRSIHDVVGPMMDNEIKMALTRDDWRRFNKASNCALCDTEFIDGKVDCKVVCADKKPVPGAEHVCKGKCWNKCRDHDHVTGKYRDALCKQCNIQCRQQNKIPVIFHNLKGYDSHLILHDIDCDSLKAIPQQGEKYLSFELDDKFIFIDSLQFLSGSLDALVTNRKNCVVTEEVCKVSGLSSSTFLPALEKMFSALSQGGQLAQIIKYAKGQTVDERFDHVIGALGVKSLSHSKLSALCELYPSPLRSEFDLMVSQLLATGMYNGYFERLLLVAMQKDVFPNLYSKFGEKLHLLTRKGVYPYEWADYGKMSEPSLPPIEAFYSKLRGEGIKLTEYAYAQRIWREFDCKRFEDYHNIYLDSDVLLLADVFEPFRDLILDRYKIDPVFYFSLPGVAWDAMMQGLRTDESLPAIVRERGLELLTDYDMFLMFQDGIRGGNSGIMHRHAVANNPLANGDMGIADLLEEGSDQETSYIKYLDANNLYGGAMIKSLPYGNFEWLEPTPENIQAVLDAPQDGPIGYNLEVDLEYPKEIHEAHAEFPLAPEKMVMRKEQYSSWLLGKIRENNLKPGKVEKLMQTLTDKKKYKIHFSALQLYLELGMKLTHVHRIIRFSQHPIFKSYIMKNTSMRAKATTDFEKDLWKLMNNALFGKTMEDKRKHTNCNFVNHKTEAGIAEGLKRASSPLCNKFDRINDTFTCYYMKKRQMTLNKPIYIGQAILDLSKVHMYSFHYNQFKRWYPGEKSKLLFSDTDSLTYHIFTDDFVDDVLRHGRLDEFDTSNYDKSHPLFSNDRKAVVGKFKDEMSGQEIKEFIGLRSKCYSVLLPTDSSWEEKKRLKGIAKGVVKKEIRHSHYKQVLDYSTTTGDICLHHSFNNLRSRGHTIRTERVNKISLSCVDDKRYISNCGVASMPYGHYQIAIIEEAEINAFIEELGL